LKSGKFIEEERLNDSKITEFFSKLNTKDFNKNFENMVLRDKIYQKIPDLLSEA
jgi:hypothetical protein